MNIAVDIGNTHSKIGFFDGDKLVDVRNDIPSNTLSSVLIEQKANNIIIASVTNFDTNQFRDISSHFDRMIILDHTTAIPIKNYYKTPKTLGVDRLAAVVGANKLFPNENCLTIDIGTCIKYDLIDCKSVYLGGAISPGLLMKMKALNTFTARLPLIDIEEEVELIGTSTEASIKSGVIQGTISELNGMIGQFQVKNPDIKVILCGGHTNFFESKLKEPIFAIPELVLMGLITILLYNVD